MTYTHTRRIIECIETGDMVELAYLLERIDKEELSQILTDIILTLLNVRSPLERNKLREMILAVGTNDDIVQLEMEFDNE